MNLPRRDALIDTAFQPIGDSMKEIERRLASIQAAMSERDDAPPVILIYEADTALSRAEEEALAERDAPAEKRAGALIITAIRIASDGQPPRLVTICRSSRPLDEWRVRLNDA
jgi:hypothetical protein